MDIERPIRQAGPDSAHASDSQVATLTTSPEAPTIPWSGDTEPESTNTAAKEDVADSDDFHPGLRLWIIILGLGVTLLLTALENTIITVAMPEIVSDLGLDDNYIWITNAFFICRCAAVELTKSDPLLVAANMA